MYKNTLWTRNFKLLTAGTFISSLGGIGLNIAFGLVIFDHTQSTFLSGIFSAVTMIPYIVLPLIVGPHVDSNDPLKVLLRNEKILIFIFILAGLYVHYLDFSYLAYMLVVICISAFGIVSETASQSITPQLIDKENFSRGYAIISTIYPLSQVIVAPIALIIYSIFGLGVMFFIYAFLTLIDVIIESNIKHDFTFSDVKKESVSDYICDLKDGISYLKEDKGLSSVLLFFSIVVFTSAAGSLWYPFFARSSTLTLYHYGIITAVSSAGYMFGGLFHYFVKIKDTNRYTIALFVYFTFVLFDGMFFFMPFMMMVIIRFVLGMFGMNSANIRTTAVQQRLNPLHRAKVNGFFSIVFSIATIMGQILIGFLGDLLPYTSVMLLCQFVYLLAILVFIIPKRTGIKELYNYSTQE